jgi:hypothetical protein
MKGRYRASLALALAVGTAAAWSSPLRSQERVYDAFHLPASHNWAFRAEYPAVDRLFNAFDYGHGILYETLWTRADEAPEVLEDEIFDHLTRDVLADPPRLPMPEAAFMPEYARLVPRAKQMFDWAHVLHRQAYDILADPLLSEPERDAAMEDVLQHYLRSDLAFSAVPKGMQAMDGQYFSRAFRSQNPRFNGLIWAYHWLQVAVYEPLLAYADPAERQAGVAAATARFWQMVGGAPETLPSEMPMTPAIAPLFTNRYPRVAAVFDNLHMMHDVISDVLVSADIPKDEKRAEIYRQIDLFRSADEMAVSDQSWMNMAIMHGVDAQGGPALGLLP